MRALGVVVGIAVAVLSQVPVFLVFYGLDLRTQFLSGLLLSAEIVASIGWVVFLWARRNRTGD